MVGRYIADDDAVGPLFVRPMWQGIGVSVIGRHLLDLTNGWQGMPPTGEHVVVVSHRLKPCVTGSAG